MANLTTSPDIDTFMGSADNASARTNLGAMAKSVYDPQDIGKISGGTIGAVPGGVLSMVGNTSLAGSINTDSGSGPGASGGAITTTGSSGVNAAGGNIDTSAGGGGVGGSITTSNGGGNIDTTGMGSIQFGIVGTRTTIQGIATGDCTINLPGSAGTISLTSQLGVQLTAETGWATPSSAGNKATVLTNYDISGLAAAAALVGLGDTNTQVGELTDVLQALITNLRAAGVLVS